MEILLLPLFAIGWAVTALMIAAVRSDLSKPATRRRGCIVLASSLFMILCPLIVEGFVKSINAPGEAMLLVSVTFGFAATLVYGAVLVASAAWRFFKRVGKGDNIAV